MRTLIVIALVAGCSAQGNDVSRGGALKMTRPIEFYDAGQLDYRSLSGGISWLYPARNGSIVAIALPSSAPGAYDLSTLSDAMQFDDGSFDYRCFTGSVQVGDEFVVFDAECRINERFASLHVSGRIDN